MLKTKGYIFDYGGTLDTGGCHWGKVLWHTYQQAGVPVTEARFRDAYVHGERTLAKNPIIQPDYTFRQTLDSKLHIEMEYLDCLNYHDQVLDLLYTEVCRHTAESRAVLLQLKERVPMVLVSNFYGNIRIDTHRDNLVMQHLLADEGFSYCGVIHCWSGDERLAFQLTKKG